MELTGQTEIKIQNKIFTLGSPVTHADTLTQLMYAFEQQGIEGRPIVIINPVEDSLPDLQNLLENYIENAMNGSYLEKKTTSYMFQDASDEDIISWAHSQYHADGYQSIDSLIETGKLIRQQSQLKRELDRANARRDELWKQHCLNPESNEGSEEYANLTYQVIPKIESDIQVVTENLKNVPKDLDLGTKPIENSVQEVEPEIEEEPVVEEPIRTGLMVGMGKPDLDLVKSSNLVMPLSVAKQAVTSPQNQVYKKQQEQEVPGYITVPLEYLLALGVTLYADGVPIVFTKSGKFRRIGSSDVSPVVSSYWYPVGRYN